MADLAGRSVSLSANVPAEFDAPLPAHHRAIGQWVAAREQARPYTRSDARRRIEAVFRAAVMDVLSPVDIADLRVEVCAGDDERPPALALICDSMGALDLGWIEKSNVLSTTMFESVAPTSWRAAAYSALKALGAALPVFGFDEMLEELSMYYWDGHTEDDYARTCMIEWHGHDPEDLDDEMLPSAVRNRRPEWMIPGKAAPLKHLPPLLAGAIRKVRAAEQALTALAFDASAFRFTQELYCDYIDGYEDSSTLPALTLVPFDHFARELDDIGRPGMENGFMNVAGICRLDAPGKIDAWLASLKLGADLLIAAQELIDLDPANAGRH